MEEDKTKTKTKKKKKNSKKKKQVQILASERRVAEQELGVEYKVDECNAKRAKLATTTQNAIKPLLEEIKVLEDSLLEE